MIVVVVSESNIDEYASVTVGRDLGYGYLTAVFITEDTCRNVNSGHTNAFQALTPSKELCERPRAQSILMP